MKKDSEQVREDQLNDVNGGKLANEYFSMAKRIQKQELREHKKAVCPNCGARFAPIWSIGDLSSMEINSASLGDQGYIYCRSCKQASDSSEWLQNDE